MTHPVFPWDTPKVVECRIDPFAGVDGEISLCTLCRDGGTTF